MKVKKNKKEAVSKLHEETMMSDKEAAEALIKAINEMKDDDIDQKTNNKKQNKIMQSNKEAEKLIKAINEMEKENKNNKKGDNKMSKNSKNKINETIVRINSNKFNLKVIFMHKELEFKVTHKETKKGNIKVKIESNYCDPILVKFTETENGVDIKDIEMMDMETNETKEIDEFIIVEETIVPIEVLLQPVYDFYIQNKQVRRKTILFNERTIKINGDNITLDTRLRKQGYLVEGSSLSLEDLFELGKEDDDNKLGVCIEVMRRALMEEGIQIIEEKNGDMKIVETEKKQAKNNVDRYYDLTAPDKICAIVEEKLGSENKERLMEAIEKENGYEIMMNIINALNDPTDIINIFKDENNRQSLSAVLKLSLNEIDKIANLNNKETKKENEKSIQTTKISEVLRISKTERFQDMINSNYSLFKVVDECVNIMKEELLTNNDSIEPFKNEIKDLIVSLFSVKLKGKFISSIENRIEVQLVK